jgi:ubiquinone/menaquinone biosynthesis C-methylase UbiE
MQTNKIWGEYWKNNQANTFSSHYQKADPIGIAIAKKLTDSLRHYDKEVHILDLGSGKGDHFDFLASLLPHSTSAVKITGVDYAIDEPIRINNDFSILKANINDLLPQQGLYTLITSLYALEYADIDLALSSLKKVLIPNAALLIVAHSMDSIISTKSKSTVSFYEKLITPSLTQLLQTTAAKQTKQSLEQAVIKHLSGVFYNITSDQQYDMKLVVDRIQRIIIKQGNNIEVMMAELTWYVEQLIYHKARLELQLESAQNADSVMPNSLNKHSKVLTTDSIISEHGNIGVYYHCVLNAS